MKIYFFLALTVHSISNINILSPFCYFHLFSNGIAKIWLFFWNKFCKWSLKTKSDSMNVLCCSFFRQEATSGIYFLYITWNWICYYFYISHGITWKCCGSQMSTSYSKCRSDSNLQNERKLCVHENHNTVLIMWFPRTVLNKSADTKVFLANVLAQMKSEQNWISFHITGWFFLMSEHLQFEIAKVLTTVFF